MKRILTSILLIGIIFSNAITAAATDAQLYRESPTLSSYVARLYAGSGKGEVIVGYDVRASRWGDSIGIECIHFYTDDGDLVDTVYGSTSNGLIRTDGSINVGDFDYDLPSGDYYYAEVTVFAEYNGVYDSRTVTTNTVWVR